MADKLLIGILGKRGAGKSFTWNSAFKHPVRTGKHLRKYYVSENEYVNVFLISGSPTERKMPVAELLPSELPDIVFSSFEFTSNLRETLGFFIKNGYKIDMAWLNPGYGDKTVSKLFYTFGITNYMLKNGIHLNIRNGNENIDNRIKDLNEVVYGWAKFRNLIYSE